MSGNDPGQTARVLAELAASPAYYPQKYDPVTEAILLVRMDEGAYRSASFLDDRILTPNMQGLWSPYAAIEKAIPASQNDKPLHFIFHAGHAGSTLLSRLLDEAGPVLSLREPLPLRTLAEAHDIVGSPYSLLSGDDFAKRLEMFLRLWSRGFPATQTVVLKATSSAGRLAPVLLAARPAAKAVYLNLAPEPYLATLLAGANAMHDLKGHAQERCRRIERFLGEPPLVLSAASAGELAAMSWLAEKLTEERAAAAGGARVLSLDFERMLSHLEETMTAAAAHFALPPPDLPSLARSPTRMRYSKAPEHGYSPALRAELLTQARREHAVELRKGLDWLDGMVDRYGTVAGLLAT